MRSAHIHTLSLQFRTVAADVIVVVVVLQLRAVAWCACSALSRSRSRFRVFCFPLPPPPALLLSTNKYAHILIIFHENYGQITWSPGGYLLYISIFFVLLFHSFRFAFIFFCFAFRSGCFLYDLFLLFSALPLFSFCCCVLWWGTRIAFFLQWFRFFACLPACLLFTSLTQSVICLSVFIRIRFRFHFALHCFEKLLVVRYCTNNLFLFTYTSAHTHNHTHRLYILHVIPPYHRAALLYSFDSFTRHALCV